MRQERGGRLELSKGWAGLAKVSSLGNEGPAENLGPIRVRGAGLLGDSPLHSIEEMKVDILKDCAFTMVLPKVLDLAERKMSGRKYTIFSSGICHSNRQSNPASPWIDVTSSIKVIRLVFMSTQIKSVWHVKQTLYPGCRYA